MAKICPQTGEKVLYLECLECEDRTKCGKEIKEQPTNTEDFNK